MSQTLQIGDVTVPGRVLMAPMTGVTDLPFRRVASRLGAPYVALRVVHSLWHAMVNVIMVRFAIFTVSSLVLAVLAVRAALAVFGSSVIPGAA